MEGAAGERRRGLVAAAAEEEAAVKRTTDQVAAQQRRDRELEVEMQVRSVELAQRLVGAYTRPLFGST